MTVLAKKRFRIVPFVFWLQMLGCVHLTESRRVHLLAADIIFSDTIEDAPDCNAEWRRCKPDNDSVTRMIVGNNIALMKSRWASGTEYEFEYSTNCGEFIGKTVTCDKWGDNFRCNADIPYCESLLIYAGVINYLNMSFEINNQAQPTGSDHQRRTFQVHTKGRYWSRSLSLRLRCPLDYCLQDKVKLLVLHYHCTSSQCHVD